MFRRGEREESGKLTIFIVVTHLGCLGGGSVTGSVYGLAGDLDVLVVGRARSGNVDGGGGYADRLLVAGDVAGSVDGGVVEVRGLLEGRAVGRDVDGGAGEGDFVSVVGLEAGTIFVLSNVDDGAVRLVVGIVLDARLGERGLGSGSKRKAGCQPIMFCVMAMEPVAGSTAPVNVIGRALAPWVELGAKKEMVLSSQAPPVLLANLPELKLSPLGALAISTVGPGPFQGGLGEARKTRDGEKTMKQA